MDTYRSHREVSLQGVPLSDGYAVARVCLFNERRHSNLPVFKVPRAEVEDEAARFARAVRIAGDRLEEIRGQVERQVGRAEAEIFVAQRMVLEDPTLSAAVNGLIRGAEALNAEAAVSRVLDEYESRLLAVDNEYLQERASDLGEVKRRLLDVLSNLRPDLQCGDEQHCQRGRNRIVVAEELTPTLTTELDTRHLLGLVTERGGRLGHGAILARALGVPAVSGVEGIHRVLRCGTEVLVNGTTGQVVIWPTEETVARTAAAHPHAVREPAPVETVAGLTVMANIRLASEAADAVRMKAEGIGLYRTEIELIQAQRLLAEQELFDRYRSVQAAMPGRRVVFRMFDLGSDKQVPFLTVPDEENPSLGWRGTRLLLGSRDLLRAQARALARVSAEGPVHVLYPMIVDLDQFRAVKAAFEQSLGGLPRGEIRHGLMFEVPSACLQAEELFREADFASVGTNDLAQYLFAADRNNERVADDLLYERPVLWALLRSLVEAAARAGKPLSVCGEMAGDPRYVPRLMEAGINTVSVSVRRIPVVRAVAASVRQRADAQPRPH